MVKPPQKMSKLIVSAIRNLREVQGSTARDILNYVTREYNSIPSIERKLQAALKRGLDQGILKNIRGHFSLNTDPEMMTESGLMERGGRRRRRRRRRGRSGKSKSRSRGRGRRRRRRGGRRIKSRGGKRSRRGRSRHGRRGRSRRMEVRGNVNDIDVLTKESLESPSQQQESSNPDIDVESDRSSTRSRHSCSRSRSGTPSRSRSSFANDREVAGEIRHTD